MSNAQPNTNVALLYQTQELGRHLREALTSLGTPIVYEAATDHLDPSALEESGARVVIVNLDPEVEAHLDEVYGLLENDRYSVVFNDAQVSSGLSGWDQARWARHLAAKILGDVNIDPPRPEGAEAIPSPPPRAESEPTHIEMASDDADETIEIESEPAASYDTRLRSIVDGAAAETTPAETSASNPLDMLESRYDEMNRPVTEAYPSASPPPEDAFDFSTLEALTAVPAPPPDAATSGTGLELESLDEVVLIESIDDPFADAQTFVVEPLPVSDEPTMEGAIAAEDLAGFDLAALDRMLEEPPVPNDAPAIDVGDLGDFGEASAAGPSPVESPSAEQKPVAEPAPVEKLSGLALADDMAFAAPTAAAPKAADAPVSSLNLAAAADWSLEDMLEGDTPPPAPVPTGRADFGIEKLSAAEYLAPPTENTAPLPEPDADGLSFELMPMEEAVAPQQVEREAHEAWLDPDKVVVPPKIRRVWVLGASIGGPEAVREFLHELPRDYPALFLLAQHMGVEFVDMMAQQLARATPLTVRTPTHGERAGHGEVLIVPTTHRLQVDPEGIVVLERVDGGTYSPSIDRVLRDVADRYGANAGAIIFSGMTTDAVEGSKYLAGKGGTIFAQHPDSCVVSSMIDGVIEAGVVKFLGTPKELADQILAESTKSKR